MLKRVGSFLPGVAFFALVFTFVGVFAVNMLVTQASNVDDASRLDVALYGVPTWEYAQLLVKCRESVYSWRSSEVSLRSTGFDTFVKDIGAEGVSSFIGVLNYLGAQGWELVNEETLYISGMGFRPAVVVDSYNLCFKRRSG